MDEQLSFEEALSKLEKTVQALEAGGLKLEEAISSWTRGDFRSNSCQKSLT